MTEIHRLGKPYPISKPFRAWHIDDCCWYTVEVFEEAPEEFMYYDDDGSTSESFDCFSHWMALPDPSNDHIKDI